VQKSSVFLEYHQAYSSQDHLRRKGRRQKGVTLGLVVTKGYSPTTQPPTQIISGKAQGGNAKLLSSMPKNGMTYAESLRHQVK